MRTRSIPVAPPVAPGQTTAPFSDARVVALIALYFILLLPSLNNSLPYQGDESYYTVSALNMIDRGDYLAPFYAGEYRFNKPILTYWVAVAGYALFGPSMWSARVPILLLACLTLFATFRLALFTLGDRRKAGLAAAMLAASAMFFSFSRIAMTEMVLTFFTVLALSMFAKALAGGAHAARYAALGSVLVGLAFMTKGPVGLLPYGAALLSCARVDPPGRRKALLTLANPANLAIVAAIAVPWYAYAASAHPAAFAGDLGAESRALGSGAVAGVPERLLRYFSSLVIFIFPFSIAGAVRMIQRRVPRCRSCALVGAYILLHGLTFTLLVGVYKSRYLMPAVPLLCIVLADALSASGWKTWIRTAAAALFLQAAYYAAHPVVAHEALRELTYRWKGGYAAAGTLGIALDAKRAGWCRLYANNRNIAAPEAADFLVIGDADRPRYAGWKIIDTAVQHAALGISRGRITVTDETFHLIRRPEHDTPRVR